MMGGTGRRVLLVTPNLVPHDAIGNDVAGMATCLEAAGYGVEVFAEQVAPSLAGFAQTIDRCDESWWRDPEALLVYHHSQGWKLGEELFEKMPGRVAIKHHNITPPRFFEPFSPDHAAACRAGERSNSLMASRHDAWFWGDSEYNCGDLRRNGAPTRRCRVLPPFHVTETIAGKPPDPDVIRRYRELPGIKLLFVGGIKPNKGHRRLIEVIADYRRYVDKNVMLLLPGGVDARLECYVEDLKKEVRRRGLEENVNFIGEVTDAELRSYFQVSDVFLCLSEHEGFCVPLVEAMYFRLPIVASCWTAVAETVGDAGLVWMNDATHCFVESILTCMEDGGVARTLRERGRRRYEERFEPGVISRGLLDLVEEAFSE